MTIASFGFVWCSPWLALVAVVAAHLGAFASSAYLREEPIEQPKAWSARVELHESGFQLCGDHRSLRLSNAIVEGWRQQRDGLVLHLRDHRTVTIEASASVTSQLLAALMVRPERTSARAWIGSEAAAQGKRAAFMVGFYGPIPFAWMAALVTGLLVHGGHGSAVVSGFLTLVLVGLSFACATKLATRQLIVGSDGISIEGDFVSYQSIKSVFKRSNAVHVVRYDKPSMVLPSSQAAWIAECINTAMCASAFRKETDLERLAPRGRSLDAWRRDLAKLTPAGAGYRELAVGLERLVEVAGDARLPPGHRVGAALAVHISGDQEACGRVRMAARSCANARLRRVLERAADGEVLSADLQRLEVEHTSSTRASA